MTRRRALSGLVLAAALLVGVVYSAVFESSSAAAARAATEDLARCRQMIDRIEGFRRLPARVADAELLASQTTALIEAAAAKAGLPSSSLVRISPQAPQRVGQGPYQEKPIEVLLSGVSMRQVAGLLHELSASATPLRAKSIRLSAPRQEAAAGTWSAQVVLTYLIYQPLKSEPSGVQP